jgi:hypothetical protein
MPQAEVDEILYKMAHTRERFKSRVEEKIAGALYEFYKAECAVGNGQTRWVEHWRHESERLLGELQIALLHAIRGFKDKRKAFNEVVEYITSKDRSFRRLTENTVRKDFKLKKLKFGVPEESTKRFWALVAKSANEVLDAEDEQ